MPRLSWLTAKSAIVQTKARFEAEERGSFLHIILIASIYYTNNETITEGVHNEKSIPDQRYNYTQTLSQSELMTRCKYCATINVCEVCCRTVSDFMHVGVRGAGTNRSGVWHYAKSCGHRQIIQVEAGAAQVVYNGGPLWNTGYYWFNVYWGKYWQEQNIPITVEKIDKAVTDIERDPSYSGGLKQYAAAGGDMGIGSLKGHTIITTDPPSVVDDSQIQQQLEAWIERGKLPDLGMKAAGGIRTAEEALAIVRAGATRIGSSHSANIIETFKEAAN